MRHLSVVALSLSFFISCSHKPVLTDQQCFRWAGQGDLKQLQANWNSCKNTNNERSTTLLMVAAARGQIPAMEYLAAQGAELNERDLFGDTPLHYAVATDQTLAVKWLIERGASTASFRDDRLTALMSAILMGKKETIDVLLRASGDINVKMEDGWTALFYAVRREDPEILTKMFQRGADLSIRSNDNETALDLAIEQKWAQGIQMLKSFSKKSSSTVSQ